MRARLAMAALAASLCLAPGTGQAQDSLTVAIAPFSGRGGTTVTRRVASALRDRADVVSSRAASGAARNANIEGIGATGISDFADAVNAQIAIVGEVEVTGGGRRRRHRRRSPSTRTVRMVAYAASGEELARAEFSPPAGRRGNDEIDQESQALYGRAQTAWDALHAAPPPEPEPEHHWEPEPEPEEPSEAPQDGLAFLSAWVGLVIRTRDALVTLAAPGERRYGATYAELGLAAELRPFASEAHLGRGTFVTFDFFHSVGLGSVVDDPAMSSVDSTNFARLQLMAGWMAPLGDVVELGVGIGGGFEGYYFAPNPVLPTTEIAYIRPAARGRVRLLEETVVLELDLAYRAVLGTGDIAGSFGQDAETHGVDVGAGLTGNLSRIADLGFTWAVRFHYVGYFMSYAGVASDAQGTSGAEQSVRFTILAGWSF